MQQRGRFRALDPSLWLPVLEFPVEAEQLPAEILVTARAQQRVHPLQIVPFTRLPSAPSFAFLDSPSLTPRLGIL